MQMTAVAEYTLSMIIHLDSKSISHSFSNSDSSKEAKFVKSAIVAKCTKHHLHVDNISFSMQPHYNVHETQIRWRENIKNFRTGTETGLHLCNEMEVTKSEKENLFLCIDEQLIESFILWP